MRLEISKRPDHTKGCPYLRYANQQQFLSLVGAVYEKCLGTQILYMLQNK
jgi:hypothetical protein